tara:strand:- start:10884 stop:12413 length:1530 start_codon:yes stop_codon:yes gene_type:complete
MVKQNNIRILSRKSDLAIIQARMVGKAIKKKFPSLKIQYHTKSTKGDIDQTTPLSVMETEGVFTADIRNNLIKNNCDLAVHSWKDLPLDLGSQTLIAGTLERGDIRDILFIKKQTIKNISKKSTITVLSSSPRRCYNLTTFLKNYLPFKKKIKFKDIRGNIPTRFKKFNNNEGDILIVAKVAVDRFFLNKNKKNNKHILLMKNIINISKWMIVPLSQNPAAPGQGGLAIEVLKKNKKIINIIKSINDTKTYDCIINERKRLGKFGGGCHQKIGASYFPILNGTIISERGELDNDKKFWNWYLIRNKKLKKIKINKEKIFPKELKDYNWFNRIKLIPSIKKINNLKNHCILISRKSALPKEANLKSENIIWTSGMKTWKYLAGKNIWVNGTSDGIGEDLDPNISSLTKFPWIKLTHDKAIKTSRVKKIIPTYKLVPRKIVKNIEKKSHFYWMSSSAFKLAVANLPKILKAEHACGPGNTYKEIKKMIKNKSKLNIYLSYKDWKKAITNES